MFFGLSLKVTYLWVHLVNIFYKHFFHQETYMMERRPFPYSKEFMNIFHFHSYVFKQWMLVMTMNRSTNRYIEWDNNLLLLIINETRENPWVLTNTLPQPVSESIPIVMIVLTQPMKH